MTREEWLWYSVRRQHIDKDLASIAGQMRGAVLEIGAGRKNRRGRFQPPADLADAWLFADLSPDKSPHVLADCQALPFPDATFDTLLCLEVLEYVAQPELAFAEFARVLRPGALAIVTTPFFHRMDAPHDRWRFTQAGIMALSKNAGLDAVEIRPQGAALATAVNTLKYCIAVQSLGWKRRLIAWFVRPFLNRLLAWDSCDCMSIEKLTGFATGYMLLAKRPAGGAQGRGGC